MTMERSTLWAQTVWVKRLPQASASQEGTEHLVQCPSNIPKQNCSVSFKSNSLASYILQCNACTMRAHMCTHTLLQVHCNSLSRCELSIRPTYPGPQAHVVSHTPQSLWQVPADIPELGLFAFFESFAIHEDKVMLDLPTLTSQLPQQQKQYFQIQQCCVLQEMFSSQL